VLLRRIAGLHGIRPGMYLGEELAETDVPTLVLWGEHDMAPLDEGRRETAHRQGPVRRDDGPGPPSLQRSLEATG